MIAGFHNEQAASSCILARDMQHTKPVRTGNKKVEARRSSAGLGLFAKVPFKRGDRIIEYVGEIIKTEEADRRGGKYLFIINDDWVIDGKSRENLARYANHSCKPNAEAELDEDAKRVRILARKKILPGEEITYDYGKDYWDEYIKPHGCKCAACLAQ
jgi:SET domain-containing protein